MKKTINKIYLLNILIVLIMFGCSEEEIVQTYNKVEITASLTTSRTSYLSENGVTKVSWVEGDAIGLYTGSQCNIKHLAVNSQETSSLVAESETLHLNEGDTVLAIYPYSEHYGKISHHENIKKGKLPLGGIGHQYHENGLSPYDYMYAYGVVKNKRLNLLFEHIYAILRITMPSKMIKENSSFSIRSTENIATFSDLTYYDIKKKEFTGELFSKELHAYIPNDSLKKETITIDLAILPQSESAIIEMNNMYIGITNLNSLYVGKAPKGGMKAGNVYKINLTEEKFVNRKKEDLKALKALYKATNGENWKNKTNWFTDNPLYSWHGLSYAEDILGESPKFDYVSTLRLANNNLTGTLPKEFVYFMNNIKEIDLSNNGMVGKIPQEVLKHYRWNEIGWNVIQQNPWIGGGFDLSEGSNLYTKDFEAEYLTGEKTMFLNILNKNKVTLLMSGNPTDAFANLLLSYYNKGFGILSLYSESREDGIEHAEQYPIKEGITRIWENENFTASPIRDGMATTGSFFLLDNKGCVIDYYMRNWGIPESFYSDKIDSVLHARLGEPEDHPPFVTEYYTSTDYSSDGEVVVLQKATVGKGIDLVFMGDAYVDKAMNDGGKYVKDMKASMEYFFEVEPYKSFRNRFNVYAVKVVSPNEESAEGCEQKINYNDEVCFEYAGKIQGIDLNQVTIVNVTNHPNDYFVIGYANMYETGASVAHIELGGPSSIIVHEAGGHGFAKLLDEYIYDGYESNWLPDNEVESFNNWIKTEYHNKGWGVNVDTTYDPEKVIWSHFLKDERYKKEVGIYEGAWLYPYNLWRASENSVMNNNYSWFNAPSREAIYKRIMELSEGEGWTYNYEDFVTYDGINRNAEGRSVSTSSESKQKVHKDHRPPTFIKGSWRNAAKGKHEIVIPFR